MAELKDQIKTGLDEARTLVLGAQVLLGFEYQAAFQKRFEQFPFPVQCMKLGSLGLMLLALALLLAPAAYHCVVDDGRDSTRLRGFVTWAVSWAVLPFALGLGIDFSIALLQQVGLRAAAVGGVAAAGIALFLWYGMGYAHRWQVERRLSGGEERHGQHARETLMQEGKEERVQATPLHDRINQALTETRVVLPGAQALLGFQFAAMLMEGFEKLPEFAKHVHLASLGLIALATVFLMTPAAYHRIAERGEDTEHFHRLAGRMITLAMLVLAPGVCGDFFVVALKITHSFNAAVGLATAALACFYGLWFGYTAWKRGQLRHHFAVQPAVRQQTPSG